MNDLGKLNWDQLLEDPITSRCESVEGLFMKDDDDFRSTT